MDVPAEVQTKIDELSKLAQDAQLNDEFSDKAKEAFSDFDDALGNAASELKDSLVEADEPDEDEEDLDNLQTQTSEEGAA